MVQTPAKQMPKNFDPKEAEPRLYEWWEKNGYFKPEVADDDAESFTISMPPPNVTGALHIGHALFTSLEDLMTRYERMRGKAALWLPGTDHAGIATQLQVEKLLRSEGTSRQEVGYDEFLRRTWQWKEEHGGTIIRQLRRLGASCDWDRERFTMDDGLSSAVEEVFIKLYEEGLIYRGPKLVNWSPGLQTSVSDLEVEDKEINGKLYYFNYPVEDGEAIPVATTRPETILGDTAVCVHPDDDRYKHMIGKKAIVPMLNREIPIIADEYVDMEFGTGALKITPAHDFNDYDLGQKHELEMINVMNPDASINENGGDYNGLDRYEARKKLWADMEAAGMTIKVDDHAMVLPVSQRGGEAIEPMLSTQWFVKIQPLADKAMKAVYDGDIKFVPERFEKDFFRWMENIHDWNISRQLWWGHRIPVWYGPNDEVFVGREEPTEGGPWIPEEDVLDTWFSSGLWPFSTLGWPDENDDVKRYYPTAIMETGWDILFFWVARMMMFGLWFTDEAPFHTVYLHGLVRDEKGRKFSKTIGNVIDPLELVEQYGADPLRYTLITSGTPGQDINLDTARVENNFRFINKIWNMVSYTRFNLETNYSGDLPAGPPPVDELDLPQQWILSRLNSLTASVQRLFDSYQYGEAGRQIYEFMWHEFADWYIEFSKYPIYDGDDKQRENALRTLVHVLDTSLRLLHPFMPFATEETWGYLPVEGDALIIAKWPEADESYINEAAEGDMNLLIDLVRGVRNTRDEYNVEPKTKIKAVVSPGSHKALLEANSFIFSRVPNTNVTEMEMLADSTKFEDEAATIVANDVTVYLPLAGMVDVEAECARLNKELGKVQQGIGRSEGMLNNQGFVANAPESVVQKERENLADLQASRQQIEERIAQLCG
ncbi:MAG: valine--tRNA ligase [Chloroflexota bacterium]